VIGGIPTRSTICTTLGTSGQLPSFSQSVTVGQINTAIAGCAANEVVFLNTGTYTLANGSTCLIFNNHSNVTLRGAGPKNTIIKFTGNCSAWGEGGNVYLVSADTGAGGSGYSNGATWTAGYSIGTTSITLTTIQSGSIANLAVGSMLFLDQLDDSTCLTSGDAFYGQTAGACSTEGGSANGRPSRGQQQPQIVTSLTGSGPWTVGISPGIRLPNIRSGQSPGAWWDDGPPIQGVGIESLTIDNSGTSATSAVPVIFAFNAYNCWLYNTRVIQSTGAAGQRVWWGYQDTHITIANNYFYGSGIGAADDYGPDAFNGADFLVVNNITQHIGIPLNNEGCIGCVFVNNFSTDDWFTTGGPGWMYGSFSRHGVGDAFIMWEGNQGPGFIWDDVHGSNNFSTAFRNYAHGVDPAGGGPKNQETIPVQSESVNRFANFVGNVLGTPGYHTTYQVNPSSATDAGNSTTSNVSIYAFGYSGDQGTYDSNLSNDTFAVTSHLRWANYDAVHAATQYNSSEIPSGLSKFSSAVPSSHTIPPSFYYSSIPTPKPSGGTGLSYWKTPWGTPPFPAIGGDLSGGNITNSSGFANNIPAALCYYNSSPDPAYSSGYAISAASWSSTGGGTATLTIVSGSTIAVDDTVRIDGTSPAGWVPFDHTVAVTAKTGTTVSYLLPTNPGSSTSTGTLTTTPVLSFDGPTCYQSDPVSGGTGGSVTGGTGKAGGTIINQ
jgi:hypothetical protein